MMNLMRNIWLSVLASSIMIVSTFANDESNAVISKVVVPSVHYISSFSASTDIDVTHAEIVDALKSGSGLIIKKAAAFCAVSTYSNAVWHLKVTDPSTNYDYSDGRLFVLRKMNASGTAIDTTAEKIPFLMEAAHKEGLADDKQWDVIDLTPDVNTNINETGVLESSTGDTISDCSNPVIIQFNISAVQVSNMTAGMYQFQGTYISNGGSK